MDIFVIFRYVVNEPKDNAWGTLEADGTWNGIIGQLSRKVRISSLCGQYAYMNKISMQPININTNIVESGFMTYC